MGGHGTSKRYIANTPCTVPQVQPTSFFDIGIHIELGGFAEYLDLISTNLRDHKDTFERDIEAQANRLDARAELFDKHSDRWHALAIGFPARFFNSFLSALCAWSEAELASLCRVYEGRHPNALKLSDLSDKGLRRCQTYLKRVAGVHYPDKSKEWSVLLQLFEIRNHLAHAAASAATIGTEARELLDAHGCVAPGVDEIRLTEPFCREAMNNARGFFEQLDRALPDELKGW